MQMAEAKIIFFIKQGLTVMESKSETNLIQEKAICGRMTRRRRMMRRKEKLTLEMLV